MFSRTLELRWHGRALPPTTAVPATEYAMRLEKTIDIAAPPERVWRANVAVEDFPKLTPSMERVEIAGGGPFAVGSRVVIKQPGFPAATWVVTSLDPGRSFTWESRNPGALSIATHELEPTPDGGTRLRLVVEMSGLTARLLWPFIKCTARRFVEQEANGFKTHCENGGAPDS